MSRAEQLIALSGADTVRLHQRLDERTGEVLGSYFVHGSPDAPVYLPGLTRRLEQVFFGPAPAAKERQRGPASGSSRKRGDRIHLAIRHEVNCKREDRCTCGLLKPRKRDGGAFPRYRQPANLSNAAHRALCKLNDKGYLPLAAEVPLASKREARVATAVDLLCQRRDLPKVATSDASSSSAPPLIPPSILVSVKSFAGSQLDKPVNNARPHMLAGPLANLPLNTPRAQAQVQALCEHLLAEREYKVYLEHWGVLFVASNGASEPEWDPAPAWARDERLRETVWQVLTKTRNLSSASGASPVHQTNTTTTSVGPQV